MPEITVLMPTRNRRGTIREAIASVVQQQFRDWELVVVNDGGESVEDITSAFQDRRIKYMERPARGKADALNAALQQNNSAFVAYLDDDDLYYPDHLATLHQAIKKGKPPETVVYTLTQAQVWARRTDSGRFELVQSGVPCKGGFSRDEMQFENQIPNLNVLHARELFDWVGWYDPRLFSLIDWDMWKRFAYFCSFSGVSRVTGCYRRIQGVSGISLEAIRHPEAVVMQKQYIRNKIPIITHVVDLEGTDAVTPADSETPSDLTVCVVLQKRTQLTACIRGLNRAVNAAYRVIFAGNTSLLREADVAPSFDYELLECDASRGYAELFSLLASHVRTGRIVLYPGHVFPGEQTLQHHQAFGESIVIGPVRTEQAVQDTGVFNETAVPAYVAAVYSDVEQRDFYYVQNSQLLENISFPAGLLRELAHAAASCCTPIFLRNAYACMTKSQNKGVCYQPKAKAYRCGYLAWDGADEENLRKDVAALYDAFDTNKKKMWGIMKANIESSAALNNLAENIVSEGRALIRNGATIQYMAEARKQTVGQMQELYRGMYHRHCLCQMLAGN
jgi:hypothetical protein